MRLEFPPVSTAEWEAAIAKDLKGADYEKKLVWRTDEGIAVRPYYRSEHLPAELPSIHRENAWEEAQSWSPPDDAIRADYLHEAGRDSSPGTRLRISAGRGKAASADCVRVRRGLELLLSRSQNCALHDRCGRRRRRHLAVRIQSGFTYGRPVRIRACSIRTRTCCVRRRKRFRL